MNFRFLRKLLPELKKNILLKNYTTLRIGGRAKYFFVAKNKKDLIKAILAAKKINLPFFILGRGSNLLVSDKGDKGLVIKIQNSKFKNQKSKIMAEAGTTLGETLNASARAGLTGLEWAIGIPGTVGGAIYGNAGAFGSSMKEIVWEVEVLDTKNLKTKKLKNKDCKFGYRDSIFKNKKNLVVLSAILKLKKGNKKEIENKIRKYFNDRKKTQPLNFLSAGSIFKNPTGFSAGELIDKCGLKGQRVGNVKVSEKHANFIVNLGRGKAKDVITLINLVKKEVKNKFGIVLEEEIVILNGAKKTTPLSMLAVTD